METISLTIKSSRVVSYHWLISWAKVSWCKLEAKVHESRSWWVCGPQWDIFGGPPQRQTAAHASGIAQMCENWNYLLHSAHRTKLGETDSQQISFKSEQRSHCAKLQARVFSLETLNGSQVSQSCLNKCGAPFFLTCISEHLFPLALGQYQQYHPELIGREQPRQRTGRSQHWDPPADEHSVTGRRLDRRIISPMSLPATGREWCRHVKTAVGLRTFEKRTGAEIQSVSVLSRLLNHWKQIAASPGMAPCFES